jgi:uncharacterized protein YdaU (DUF1376 family)
MGTLRWYKRDPRAALAGMMGLTLEERGAYNTILDLIYINDGKLPDDSNLLAGWMHVDIRVVKRLRARLLSLGKIYLHGGCIRNERCDEELHKALLRIRSAAEAGLTSALSRGLSPRNIKTSSVPPLNDRSNNLQLQPERVFLIGDEARRAAQGLTRK